MLIKKHDKSGIVELGDGSLWRIWPGDIDLTLNWLPTTLTFAFWKLVTSFVPTRLSIKLRAHGRDRVRRANSPRTRCLHK